MKTTFDRVPLSRVAERYPIQCWIAVAHDGVVCLAEVVDRASRDLVTAVSFRAGTPVTVRTVVAVVCYETFFHYPCSHYTTLNFLRTRMPDPLDVDY